jgi:predicted transcriptional regulator
MRHIPLTEFAAEHGQTKAAEMLGITQGALSKALRVGRRVTVSFGDDGSLTAQELRPFPAQQSKSAA